MPDDNVSRHGRNEPGEVAIDWEEIERWDRAYYLHNVQAQDSYVFTGVELSLIHISEPTRPY